MMQRRAFSFLVRVAFKRNLNYQTCMDRALTNVKSQYIRSSFGMPLIINKRGLRNSAQQVESNNKQEIAEANEETRENFNALTATSSSEVEKIEKPEKSIAGLFEIIHKKQDNLNEHNVVKFLGQTASLYIKNKSQTALEEIKDSESFIVLLKSIQKCLKVLHADEVVEILYYLKTLQVSHNSVIVRQILQLLKEDFNNLSFHKAMFLHRYVYAMNDNNDAVAIKTGLQVAFPIIFQKSFDRDNDLEVKDAVMLAALNAFPVQCVEEILSATYRMCKIKGDEFSVLVIRSLLLILKNINIKSPFYLELKIRSFKLFKKLWQNLSTDDLRHVFRFYSELVNLNRIRYDSVLVGKIINTLVKDVRDPIQKFGILRSLSFLRHIQYDLIDELSDKLIDNPNLLNEDFIASAEMIASLARSDYNSLRKEKWEKLKPVIENLPILKNESSWKQSDTYIALQLVSLGIYPHNVFNYLHEKYDNHELFALPRLKIHSLLVLNQAFSKFEKPLISAKRVNTIIENNTLIHSRNSNLFRGEIKPILELSVGVADCVLLQRYTNQGYLIDGLMALDDKNEPISFEGVTLPKNLLIGEIKSLLNCKNMVLLLYIPQDFCIRNTSTLNELYSVTLKTLNDSGYIVFPILENQWKELVEEERGFYLWKCVQEKIKNKK